MIHELKTEQPFFDEIFKGTKTFEIRENDRDFKVGDVLVLQEYDPDYTPTHARDSRYSGREVKAAVTYITDFALKEGYVCMAISQDPILVHTLMEKEKAR